MIEIEIKTNYGIAKAMPLSDIQEYNLRLKQNTNAIYVIGFSFLGLILVIFLFLFWYVHTYNVLNHIVEKCL